MQGSNASSLQRGHFSDSYTSAIFFSQRLGKKMDSENVIFEHLKSKSITPIHKRILHKAKRYYKKKIKNEEVSASGDRTKKRNQHKAQNYYNRKEREKIAKLVLEKEANHLEHIKRYILKNKTPVLAAPTNVSAEPASIPVISSSKPVGGLITRPLQVSPPNKVAEFLTPRRIRKFDHVKNSATLLPKLQVRSLSVVQEEGYKALDKPIEATGNPPGKRKPKNLIELAQLARERIPHTRLLKLSNHIKQKRFDTYQKKAEYLIDNYKRQLKAQFTFISKNTYACDDIVIKFAPNLTEEYVQYEHLQYEIYILSQLKQIKTKHIVNILHHGEYNNHLYWITSRLTAYVPLNELTAFNFDYRSVYNQIQEALRVMHEHGYAHHNMILNNIMFNQNTNQICIVDFSRTCVADACIHTNVLDSTSPSYPPYYGHVSADNQPKHADYYFMAVVLVFLISKGAVNPIEKTRAEYMNSVKTFARTLTDIHEIQQIKTAFVSSSIKEQIFSAHTPKSPPQERLAAQYLIDTEILNKTHDYKQKNTIQKVGEGTYGCVFRIGLKFIIKIPKNNEIESLTDEINTFKGISVLNHPNIVTYVYSDTYRGIPYLILTYLQDYMTLYNTVQCRADYNTQNMYDQIMSAVNAIHNAGYAHYDLSLGNIMYNHITGHVCIIDFGVACHIDCKGFYNTDLNADPAFPPHHGNGRMPTEQGKTSDKYFIAVAVVYMLSKGTINHYEERTRTEYMTKFNDFLEKPEFKKWQKPVTNLLMASFDYSVPL